MIRKTKQTWLPGHSVKVGFLSLIVVKAVSTPGDYMPDAYILKNKDESRFYRFVPHFGLESIGYEEAMQ